MRDEARAVLVTGASSGIGRATTLRLARGGTIVYAGVRTQRDADALASEGARGVRPLLLDVTDGASIARAHATIAGATERLCGIVNNAGIALAGPLEILPPDELRRQFDVNFFGPMALTQTFLPLLRATRGRVVNVSSIGGKLAAPCVGAYAASKFALEAASDALRVELHPFGVDVVVIEPGAVKTPIWQSGEDASLRIFGGLPEATRAPWAPLIAAMTGVSQAMARRGIAPDRVAAAIETALFAPRPRARYLVGSDARLRLLVARLPEALRDRIVAAAVGAPWRRIPASA